MFWTHRANKGIENIINANDLYWFTWATAQNVRNSAAKKKKKQLKQISTAEFQERSSFRHCFVVNNSHMDEKCHAVLNASMAKTHTLITIRYCHIKCYHMLLLILMYSFIVIIFFQCVIFFLDFFRGFSWFLCNMLNLKICWFNQMLWLFFFFFFHVVINRCCFLPLRLLQASNDEIVFLIYVAFRFDLDLRKKKKNFSFSYLPHWDKKEKRSFSFLSNSFVPFSFR